MPSAATLLLALLAVVALGFAVFLARHAWLSRSGSRMPRPYELLVGFLTDFFDSLGIGSFATTTALWRARRTVPDEHIPGTLNVGHTLPTVAQALLWINAVNIEAATLIGMIVAAVAGALLGAPIVAGWPRRRVQTGLGLALLALCAVLVYRQLVDLEPAGVPPTGLSGGLFVVGIATNFVLGALMTIGVGLYAPCLLLVSLLGMSPKAAFPIMMGSCAFLMPLASVPFVRRGAYSPRAALGLTLAGIPGVLIAVLIVQEMNLSTVKWLVAVVIVYTAVSLLRAARAGATLPPTSPSP